MRRRNIDRPVGDRDLRTFHRLEWTEPNDPSLAERDLAFRRWCEARRRAGLVRKLRAL